MKVKITHSALGDLESIREYYKSQGVPHNAERFIAEIFEHLKLLTSNPDIGRIVPEFDSENIRELIHSPFRVVYSKDGSTLHVIRVWCSERLLRLDENQGS